jgi:DnaJ-class molecular chaperone
MNRYQEITEARKLLDLSETETMESIKSNFRKLLAQWHPDTCIENPETCTEMTRKIISAHQTIMDYCGSYQYSFSEEAVKRHLSPEDWWFERFGDDPIWGTKKNKK